MTQAIDVQALQVAALTATRACRCLKDTDSMCSFCIEAGEEQLEYEHPYMFHSEEDCISCNGTGEVPVLGDAFGLQVECKPCEGEGGWQWLSGPSDVDSERCEDCQGRGWTPSGDAFAWMRAGEASGIYFTYDSDDGWCVRTQHGVFHNDFYTAITDAVLAQAREG